MLVARDARVVAGGELRGAERAGDREHRVEADVAVAAHARVGRAALGVALQEVVHDLGAEALAQVEREVRDAHAVGERAGAGHGLGRAAAELAVGGRVGPQLERHGDHLVARVERELRSGGRVHPAAHRDERAPRAGRERGRAVARGGAECAVEGVGGQLGCVARRGQQPAELLGYVVGRDARGVEQRSALDELHDRAAGGANGGATVGVEAGLGDAVGLDSHGDPDEVAAGRAARRSGMRRGGQGAQSVGLSQVRVQRQGQSVPHGENKQPQLAAAEPGVGPCCCKWVSSTAGHGPTASGTPIPVMLASTCKAGWRTSSGGFTVAAPPGCRLATSRRAPVRPWARGGDPR